MNIEGASSTSLQMVADQFAKVVKHRSDDRVKYIRSSDYYLLASNVCWEEREEKDIIDMSTPHQTTIEMELQRKILQLEGEKAIAEAQADEDAEQSGFDLDELSHAKGIHKQITAGDGISHSKAYQSSARNEFEDTFADDDLMVLGFQNGVVDFNKSERTLSRFDHRQHFIRSVSPIKLSDGIFDGRMDLALEKLIIPWFGESVYKWALRHFGMALIGKRGKYFNIICGESNSGKSTFAVFFSSAFGKRLIMNSAGSDFFDKKTPNPKLADSLEYQTRFAFHDEVPKPSYLDRLLELTSEFSTPEARRLNANPTEEKKLYARVVFMTEPELLKRFDFSMMSKGLWNRMIVVPFFGYPDNFDTSILEASSDPENDLVNGFAQCILHGAYDFLEIGETALPKSVVEQSLEARRELQSGMEWIDKNIAQFCGKTNKEIRAMLEQFSGTEQWGIEQDKGAEELLQMKDKELRDMLEAAGLRYAPWRYERGSSKQKKCWDLPNESLERYEVHTLEEFRQISDRQIDQRVFA